MQRNIVAAFLLACQVFAGVESSINNVHISYMSPRTGSLKGGTRVTIHGTGFAENQFNFGSDSHVGNRVEMISDTSVYSCEIHKDGCTETQIMCYTPTMPDDYYYIRVFVDGEAVPDGNHCASNAGLCNFRPIDWATPKVYSVTPFANTPRNVINMRGYIVTDLFEQNVALATNGRSEEFKRIYNNGQLCELRVDDTDELYGLELDSDTATWGDVACKTGGSYVGNQNVSFIISGGFGRSMYYKNVLKPTGQNTLAMYQTYAEIYNVTPSVGGLVGGTPLTIYGQYFDETDAPAEVLVGGEPCEVIELADDKIVCLTPAEVTSSTGFSGNRGWTAEIFNNGGIQNIPMDAIFNMTDPAYVLHLDEGYFYDTEGRNYFAGNVYGFFLPPKTSGYKFMVKADDSIQLYLSDSEDPAGLELIAESPGVTNNYYKFDAQISSVIQLEADKKYYMKAVYKEWTSTSNFYVTALLLDTPFTSAHSEQAIDEVQVIKITSEHQDEVQLLSFGNWTTQSSVAEVQTVNVSSYYPADATYRLGVYGAFTELLSVMDSASDVQEALNNLATLPDGATVSSSSISNGMIYTVTFSGEIGHFPLLEVHVDESSQIEVESLVERVTAGVPSLSSVSIYHEGVPSSPISYSDLDENTVSVAVHEIHSVRCPSSFLAARGNKYFTDYEEGSVSGHGKITSEIAPFCGRYSAKNPKYIFNEAVAVLLDTYQRLCFAYKGRLQGHLRVGIIYNTDDERNLEANTNINANLLGHTDWGFVCLDIMGLVKDKVQDAKLIRLSSIKIYPIDDLYVDTVFIGTEDLVEDFEGIDGPMRLEPTRWLLDELEVTGTKEEGFELTFTTLLCQDEVGLVGITGGNMTEIAWNKTEFHSTNWPSAVKVVSARLEEASPPISGSFDISYGNQTVTGVTMDYSAYDMARLLETFRGTGQVTVEKEGQCSGYDWEVTFITAGGDHEAFELDISNLDGNEVEAEVETVADGGIMFQGIPGDLLRTYEDNAQVTVKINHIPSVCEGDCSFAWNISQTPSMSSFSPTEGTSGTTVTITGSGFDGNDTAMNQVIIGGVECDVTSATSSQIQCTIGEGLSGTFNVKMTELSKGRATDNSATQFTYLFEVDDISPLTGSSAGGTELTIQGSGFSENVTVPIGGGFCDIVHVNYSQIVCTTPSGSGSQSIEVQSGSETDGTDTFVYTTPSSTVYSISPTEGQVGGNMTLTISGSGFGSVEDDEAHVLLGAEYLDILTWSDTEITTSLPSKTPGSYKLAVYIGSEGYADTSAIDEIEYTLVIHSVEPIVGSVDGGTSVTITGAGFPEDADDMIEISVGHGECEIATITSTQIICDVAEPGETHIVTNEGYSADFGQGYAWEPMVVDALVGDYVQWSWTTSSLLASIDGYVIEETQTASSKSHSGGFRSSTTPTRNGGYKYQFATPGTYYYWSDFIDDNGVIALRGVVNVFSEDVRQSEFTMHVDGFEAVYNASQTSKRKRRSTSCQEATLECDAVDLNVVSSDSFVYTLAECATPQISHVYVDGKFSNTSTGVTNTGVLNDTIVILGSGFGSQDCHNEVDIGGWPCDVVDSSQTEIKCELNPYDNEMQIGVPYSVSVYVDNLGQALNTINVEIESTFTLLPSVADVSPKNGSLVGGTRLNITGFGFNVNSYVTILGTPCDIEEMNSSMIVCTTSPAYAALEDIVVVVQTELGQEVTASCTGDCFFEFAESLTPFVNTISPTTITDDVTTITVTGSGFDVYTPFEVAVFLEETECVLTTLSGDSFTCDLSYPIAGVNKKLSVQVPRGYADFNSSNEIDVDLILDSISPSSGSTEGGTYVTLTGLGFDEGDAAVDTLNCDVQSINRTEIVCLTQSGSGSKSVTVTSQGLTSGSQSFTYSSGSTPTISAVNPTSGNSGETITLTGTNLGTDTASVTVSIDGSDCSVTSATDTEAECTLGFHSAGAFDFEADVQPLGKVDVNLQFTFELSIDSVTPASGSFGGDQLITISGNGFDETMTSITVCDEECVIVGTPTASEAVCRTAANDGSGTVSCDVVMTVADEATDTESGGFQYDDSITPSVTGVSPRRGGTGGGTTVTITGTGFGSDDSIANVTIAGSECISSTFSDTEIVCVTEAHYGSTETYVRVELDGNGIAEPVNANFEYIDVWSSVWTWGGGPLPQEGDFVVIPSTMTVLLDTDTPILKFVLIQGGKLIFDEVDVELHSEVILITDGGLLQVGTEDEPFQHNATIMMHGHVRSKELPIYGTKTLAVREGTLDLHGKPVGISWTRLASTASAGDSTIELESSVEWQVGNEIIIASTGDMKSMPENEKRRIVYISADGQTLTLDSPLEYQHLGETVDVTSGVTLEARAEVGLLSHNIVVRGSDDDQWHDKIDACEEGFNTGEFATQTCFQGRFGEEIGSSQYGAQIMFHAPRPNEDLVTGRIENVEVTFAGQAFRMGRYAIHFHLNGYMNGSYVRSCGIHRSFNRAVNIHGTHEVVVEHTVIYDIMGGAFFFEDGIETGNVWQYNLAIFVKSSSSLQNADITPASFWITNPNNTIRHNAAAGGSHFGFWYRLNKHPEGPSHDTSYCIHNVELGEFYNNTAHSFGWFGLWIFQDYYPKKGGTLDGGTCQSTEPAVAEFDGLTAWNCKKGAETTGQGSVHFTNFLMVNNKITGIEVKNLHQHPQDYGDDAPMILNSVVAAEAGVLNNQISSFAITLPLARGFRVKSCTFVNYDSVGQGVFHSAKITGTSGPNNGGFTHHIEDLTYDNSPYKANFRWAFDTVLLDKDGTTTGITNGKAIPTMNTLPTDKCTSEPDFSGGFPGSVCSADVVFHRFAFNNALPSSLLGRSVFISNRFGSDEGKYEKKRMSFAPGWMVVLVDAEVTEMLFENSQHITNMSYHGKMYDFEDDEFVVVSHNLTQKPDMFTITGQFHNATQAELTFSETYYGDWTFEDEGKLFNYVVSGRDVNNPSGPSGFVDRAVNLKVFQCYYKNCILPEGVEGGDVPPPSNRPDDAVFWSDPESWAIMEDGWGGNYGNGEYGLPLGGEELHIPHGMWMVLDVEDLPKFGKIYINGVLEFEYLEKSNGDNYDLTLNAEVIFIMGGRLVVGSEDEPFPGTAQIILRGNHNSEEMLLNYGPVVGAKAMGVFGGLDMHGTNTTLSWTRLSQTANAGDNSVTLTEPVDWPVGAEVLVTTTGISPYEGETGFITDKSNDNQTLTLSISFDFDHIAVTETINGMDIVMAAEVGLLSRNVKIVGEEYAKIDSEFFGARVIVGSMLDDDYIPYEGYARLSNVEFLRCGQEGHVEPYDPRFSVAFLNLGEVAANGSYVKHCSFNHNFAPAIGVFGTYNLHLDQNVVHHTIGSAIISNSRDTYITGNLLAEIYFPGAYDGRFETFKWTYDAGVEINKLEGGHIYMHDNVVAGSERAGYHTDGQRCSEVEDDPSKYWTNNEAHSILNGVMLYPTPDGDGISPCVALNGFKVWKAYDWGVYSQTPYTTKVTDLISVDNRVGVLIIIYGPASASHSYANKFAEIRNATIVGHTAAYSCDNDVLDLSHNNMQISRMHRSWKSPSGGKIGLSFSNFISGPNAAITKPAKGTMSYQAIRGITRVSDVTFANFGTSCGDREDFAVSNNPGNDDFQHPMSLQTSTMVNVDSGNEVVYFRPNVGKINPADCVDMDCDALKKTILRDEDGTFLGTAGASVIPQSEWEWNGDPRRGLGDYRIPKTMLTDLDGNRLNVNAVAPNLGIHRDASCSFNEDYVAYKCTGPDYLNVQLESLDWDTETRRLSPVGLLSDGGYLDLINGPQDHGWCSGYTCQKRLSTFPLTIASGVYYSLHYSGTAPQDSRIHLLNADDTQTVVLGIWYSQPWRLDVSVGGRYITPTNGYYDAEGRLLFSAPTGDEFMPDVGSDISGTNYYSREDGVLHVLVRGSEPVTIITTPLILVTFNMPTLTADEFFGENIVANLAAFYDIPAEKIRIADAVREVRRKKRATYLTLTIEISESPSNDTSAYSNSTINDISASIVNAYQLGELGNIIGVEILSMAITEPPPDTSSDTWYSLTESGDLMITVEILVPNTMEVTLDPVPSSEGLTFITPPQLQMRDSSGVYLTQVGSTSDPWVVEATLLSNSNSHSQATLSGATAEFAYGGVVTFDELIISHPGEYALRFQVVSLSGADSFTAETEYFTVASLDLTGGVTNFTTELLIVDEEFSFDVQIYDKLSEEPLDDITYMGHTWTCSASASPYCPGDVTFSGPTTVDVDSYYNSASFSASVDAAGMCPIAFDFVSDPDDISFTYVKAFMIYPANFEEPVIDVSNDVIIKFDADFSTHGDGYEEQIKAAVFNHFWAEFPNTTWSNFSVYEGSIAVAFTVGGATDDMELLIDSINEKISGPWVLDYGGPSTISSLDQMWLDGEEYGTSSGLSTGPIVGIVIGCVVLAALIVIIIILAVKFGSQKNTGYGGQNRMLSDNKKGKGVQGRVYSLNNSDIPESLLMAAANLRNSDIAEEEERSSTSSNYGSQANLHPHHRGNSLFMATASGIPPAATYYEQQEQHKRKSPFDSRKVTPEPPQREVTREEIYGTAPEDQRNGTPPYSTKLIRVGTPEERMGTSKSQRTTTTGGLSVLERSITDLEFDRFSATPTLPLAHDGYLQQ